MQGTKSNNTYWLSLIGGIIILTAITVFTDNIPFTFDHVYLVSYVADHISDSGFQTLIVETAYDTAHPPLGGFLHALMWILFGKKLIVSHWLLYIFISITYFYFLNISRKLLPATQLYIPAILFFAFPVIISQTIYLSTDVMLICFLSGAIFNYLKGNHFSFYIFLSLILLCSLRGVPVFFAFFIAMQVVEYSSIKNTLRLTLCFLAATLPWIAWNVHHYLQTGWIIDNANSIWSVHRNLLSISGIAMQTGAFLFRLSEYGFIIIWILLIRKLKIFKENTTLHFLILFLIIWLVCIISLTVPLSNPISNRYLLPAYMCGLLLFSVLLVQFNSIKKNILLIGIASILFSSHFYVYPERFTKAVGYSWDCTLAAYPYFTKLEPAIQDYLKSGNKIQADKIITGGMPAYQSTEFTFLTSGNLNVIQRLPDNTQLTGSYFVYSNIMNDVSWAQKQELLIKWKPLYKIKAGNIYIQVFQNPDMQPSLKEVNS